MTVYLQSDASIGITKESTYGTAATVDQHVEFLSETLQQTVSRLQGQGLRVGRVGDLWSRRVLGKVETGGDVVFEANTVDTATFLEAAFGTVTTGGEAAPYGRLAVCATGDTPPSYTIQKGVPLRDGSAVKAHTFSGMVCNQLQINAANDAILEITASWMGKDMDTSTTLVTPAYTASTTLFHFHKASLALGGTVTMPTTTAAASGGTDVAYVRDCQITLANNLDSNGWNFGGEGKRSRIQAYGRRQITGTLTAEFDATTLRDASLAKTGMSLVLEFDGGTNELLQIVLPKIDLDSNVPNSNGGDVITQSFGFTAFEDGTNALAYALLQNTVAVS